MSKLRWVTNNFFTVDGEERFYNIDSVNSFYIKDVEYTDYNSGLDINQLYERRKITKFYIAIMILGLEITLCQCSTLEAGRNEIEDFLKNRPCYITKDEKISLN